MEHDKLMSICSAFTSWSRRQAITWVPNVSNKAEVIPDRCSCLIVCCGKSKQSMPPNYLIILTDCATVPETVVLPLYVDQSGNHAFSSWSLHEFLGSTTITTPNA